MLLMFLRRTLPQVLAFVLAAVSAPAATLVDYSSTWSYFIGVSEASAPDPGSWRLKGFDDTAWLSGAAPIGYANPPNSAPEFNIATQLPTTQAAGYLSVFFRKPFVVNNPAGVTQITLNVNVDDGYIAWINGTEVGRWNMPDGVIPYNGNAVTAIEATLSTLQITSSPASLLTPGTNMLAIQVFNANTSSSDLFMDASLALDIDEVPPTLVDVTPSPGATVQTFTTLEVVFSENVTGVDAGDLRVNGVAALSMTQVSPLDYTFQFAKPADGVLQVTWNPAHGITDLAVPPNPFVATNWSFKVDSKISTVPVVISEFLTDNLTGIKDDDGSRSDWIELYNMGSEPASLGGWFLTDSAANPTKWRLPAISLGAKNYLLIWASGKNRTNTAAALHTSFKLGKSGGYLGLYDSNTNVASEFAPAYPAQQSDISYGRDTADPTLVGFYTTPTPGAKNLSRGAGFAPLPLFSLPGGVYTNDTLSIRLTSPSGQIRYTLDGSLPVATSPLYTAPVVVNTSLTLKARVFQAGLLPGEILAETYMLVDSTVSGFTSELPLMIFSTGGVPVADHVPTGQPRTFASLVAFDTTQGRSSPLGAPEYLGQSEMGIRGQTSAGFPKKPYRVELQDPYRIDRSEGLFGLPADSDWILNNPYTDKPFMQNFLAYELFEKMGHYSVRRRFVEVFVNSGGGKVQYPRDYAGVYILLEKIKASGHRVDIAKLTPADTTEPNISGGYMFKKDKDSAGDLNFYTSGGGGFAGQTLKIHEPQPTEITPAQLSWLQAYLNRFEAALYSPTWLTATGTNHYSSFIDTDSFVDFHWIVEFTKQIDGYRLSNYMQKDRGGKVRMEPIWDWNLSFGNADYLDGSVTSGWYYTLLGDADHIWLRRLITGTTSATSTSGDPDFNQKIADRWSVLRTNVFALSNVLARVDGIAATLSEAADRDFQKWPRLGTYVWPNPSFYVTPTTYAGIITSMKSWISGRYTWIDSQFLKPPAFGARGGRVPAGSKLTLTAPSGTIYYTLDGSDPRLPGGGVSSTAALYTAAGIPLSGNARVMARARNGTRWSGPSADTFVVAPLPLALTEIMYHPLPPDALSLFSPSDFEYLEFRNTGSSPIQLAGVRITGGVSLTFTNRLLAPGARVLAVHTTAAFQSRYGSDLPIGGEYAGSLSDSGDRIEVRGPLGDLILECRYADGWYPATDGSGFSLVLNNDSVSPLELSDEASWRPSSHEGGSPGAGDLPRPAVPRVVINELVNHSGLTGVDKIELQNLSAAPADIGGWFLSDDPGIPRKYQIPHGATLPPGGFITFEETEFSGQALIPFGLSATGDHLYLFSTDGGTNLTGYRHGVSFGAQSEGVSFGRYLDSTGRELFVTMPSNSFTATNPSPWVPPLVVSEIMYHPLLPVTTNTLPSEFASSGEYLELLNRGATPVPLYDPATPTNTWHLGGAISFAFPTNLVLPAQGRILVVPFDPVANPVALDGFRAQYGTIQSPVVGPFSGRLGNAGSGVSLLFPDVPGTNGVTPYIEAERVDYNDNDPWPAGADGLGYALGRINADQFANDPVNWHAVRPSPGSAGVIPPLLLLNGQPSGGVVIVGRTVTLTVDAQGAGPLAYQWRHDGQDIPRGTNASLVLSNVQVSASGKYMVTVMQPSLALNSSPAWILVDYDSDGDGIPDSWELAHGLDPFTPADAALDPDGDGRTNLSEYLAGTDPQKPGDPVRLSVELDRDGVGEVSFPIEAYRNYRVEQSTNLASPAAWVEVARFPSVNHPSTGRFASRLDPLGNHYYRLKVSPDP